MENEQEKNNIFKYLLVVFFAMFVGTGIFLMATNKPKVSNEKANTRKAPEMENSKTDFPEETTAVIPTVASSTGSLILESSLAGDQMKVGDTVVLNLIADSSGKNIVGYDVVIQYDPLAFDFSKGVSALSDYNIYTYKKGNFLTITGLKSLQSTASPMTKVKLATLTFQPTKAGKFEFSLLQSNDKDKTDLITDKTEVLVPSLNKVVVNVN